MLDEPTTGLHLEDTRKLRVLTKLVETAKTVIVIEHNLDVIKTTDWIIDTGPEGGSGDGTVVVTASPELREVAGIVPRTRHACANSSQPARVPGCRWRRLLWRQGQWRPTGAAVLRLAWLHRETLTG